MSEGERTFNVVFKLFVMVAMSILIVVAGYWLSEISVCVKGRDTSYTDRSILQSERQDYRIKSIELQTTVERLQANNTHLLKLLRVIQDRYPQSKELEADLEKFVR